MFSTCSSPGRDPEALYKGQSSPLLAGATRSSSAEEKLQQRCAPAWGRKAKSPSPFPLSIRQNGFRAPLQSPARGFLGVTAFWATARGYLYTRQYSTGVIWPIAAQRYPRNGDHKLLCPVSWGKCAYESKGRLCRNPAMCWKRIIKIMLLYIYMYKKKAVVCCPRPKHYPSPHSPLTGEMGIFSL